MNSIDSAVSFPTPYCFYSIVNIESAWRWIPVFPPHSDSSQYNYYVDSRLCFGLSCAQFIFNHISNAIVRMLARHGFCAVVNYLDDFAIIGSTREECQWGLVTLISLLHYLGFNMSWCKVVSPTQRITSLGIELDSSAMSLCLPEDKLNWLIDLVNTFSHKASASKCQLQSLMGSLNFACQVLVICVRWSKTTQFQECQLLIPILRLSQGHPLCSVHAYERHILEFPVSQPSPAFLHYRKGHATPITHSAFTDKLRKVLSHAGFPANKFSCHSFRLGGASYAFCCGAPVELISLQGDWSSDAVLLYIAQPLEQRLSVAKLIAQNIDNS